MKLSLLHTISFFGLLGFLISCTSPAVEEKVQNASQGSCPETSHIIEPEAFAEKMENTTTYFLIEVSKEKDFVTGHIPGASRIWRPDYEEKELFPYTGMRADTHQVASLLRRLGYQQGQRLILYDRRGDVDAARFLWILNKYGHQDVVLLNGGLTAWKAKGLVLSSKEAEEKKAGNFTFPSTNQADELFMTREHMLSALQDTQMIILDTRTQDEFEGLSQKKGAFCAGNIPGSIHLDWIETVNYDTDYSFKSCEEIEPLLTERGILPDKKIITYCHSGVRSAHMAFVLTEIMGFPFVENYDGSWTEWSYYQALSIASDK